MSVGFAGTPAFARDGRSRVARSTPGFAVPLVLTQPDRPRGRGLKLVPSPVKALALARRHRRSAQPATLATRCGARDAARRRRSTCSSSPPTDSSCRRAVLDWPRHGCLNVHASLLPRWRGAAPIQRALLAGDARDRASRSCRWTRGSTPARCSMPSAFRSARATRRHARARSSPRWARARWSTCLQRLARGRPRRAGRRSRPTAPPMRRRSARPKPPSTGARRAATIDRQVRAFDPVPGAATLLAGETRQGLAGAAGGRPTRGAAPGTVLAADGDGHRRRLRRRRAARSRSCSPRAAGG